MKRLEYIILGKEHTCGSFGVLPNTMYRRSGGREPHEPPVSVHRWWSPDFRSQLYSDLELLLSEPSLGEGSRWTADDVAKAAGIGLVSAAREEIGFGLDLISALNGLKAKELRLIIDGSSGLRYVEAFDIAATQSDGIRFRLSYAVRVPRLGYSLSVRIPRRLTAFAVRAVSWLRASKRRVRARRLGHRSRYAAISEMADCRVAIFESTPKGWITSKPILMELNRRSEAVLELSPQMGAVLRKAGDNPSQLRLAVDGLGRVSRLQISKAVSRLVSGQGSVIRSERHREVAVEIVSRRVSSYLPGMVLASGLARQAVQEVGVTLTLQEDHTSPSGRAFLIESNRLGAHTVAAHHGVFDPAAPERRYFAMPRTILEWGDRVAPFPGDSTESRVVGNHLVEERSDALVAARKESRSDPIVLVAFGRPGRIVDPEFFASAIRVVALAAESSTVPFMVNIHPGDSQVFWNHALVPIEQAQLRFSRDRIYELMERAVAVITNHSTIGAEAMLADIPVICIASHRDPISGLLREGSDVAGYVAEGAAYPAVSASDVNSIVGRLVLKEEFGEVAKQRAAYARGFLYRSQARSAQERTADVLLQLARRDR